MRRRVAAEQLRQRRLYEASFLAAADMMSGVQFEEYVAELMRSDSCRA
jgi:hypothetical protein